MGETLLAKLETLARWLQLKYMARRRTTEIVEPGRIRFHPKDCRGWVLKEYKKRLKKLRLEWTAAAGGLLGDSFLHLLPEAVKKEGFSLEISLATLAGLLLFFVLEKFVSWRHCHIPTSQKHPHPLGLMNLIGDGFHNFIDGMIIAGSFLNSIPLGITTSIAVILHEIPQEIGDFGVLLYSGFGKTKALVFNFISALMAVLGAILVLGIGSKLTGFLELIIPFTAGGFIYIAGADLLPELQKETELTKSGLQLTGLLLGIGMMCLIPSWQKPLFFLK